ncbi:hypothetical protein [Nonomuraea fuscirosea]|uniref:hypothetical protein n=1 Tax=Nonomuraea fuscirosea TaxID=1291556 RepID=UPI0033FA4C0E
MTIAFSSSPRVSTAMCRLPIVVVSGGPGTGKAAFAVHVAHIVRTAFPDGHWFVRPRTSDERARDPANVLAEMLVSARLDPGGHPDGLGTRAARLRVLLADRSVLLVLDDAFDATQVRSLLPELPGVRFWSPRERTSGDWPRWRTPAF